MILTGIDNGFQVSLEMAVRVLTLALHWCTPNTRHAYMRSIEKSAALLTSRGHITGVEVRPVLTSSRRSLHLAGCFSTHPPGRVLTHVARFSMLELIRCWNRVGRQESDLISSHVVMPWTVSNRPEDCYQHYLDERRNTKFNYPNLTCNHASRLYGGKR